MKILIATGVYPPEIGGPATYTKMIETHLPKRGYEITVLPFSAVRHLPKVVRHVAYFLKCLSLARGADAIFAQDPVSVGLPAMLAARILRKRFLLRLGGDYAWEQGRLRFGVNESLEVFACGRSRFHAMVHLFKWIERRVAAAAECVAVQSAFMKKVVVCWGVPEEKTFVIPNGFDPITTIGEKALSQRELNIEGTIAVSAGRLVPWKGFEGLTAIVPEILKTIPDFTLYIIGDGPDEEKLRQLIVTRNLTRRVFLTGCLDRENLIRYLIAADVFILNTEYEGFSNQLLEVYGVGTPIVTTDIEGNRGVVDHRESGLLVPLHDAGALKDAVRSVLTDRALAEKLAEGGKKKLQEFTVERVVATTHEFLSQQ